MARIPKLTRRQKPWARLVSVSPCANRGAETYFAPASGMRQFPGHGAPGLVGMALAAIRDALIATPQLSPRPDDGLVQALLENLARGQFCEILSYSNFCLFEFQQFNSLIRLTCAEDKPNWRLFMSEAVKKCTTMAGSVAPPGWLRYGWPQTQ